VADFFKGSNLLIGAKKRVAGLRLTATDADWTTGDGPEVSGPVASLVMAMTGRSAALDDLGGEGVAKLRSRS
jgi:chitodextrinase